MFNNSRPNYGLPQTNLLNRLFEKILIPAAIVFMLCLIGSKLSAQYTILYNDAASNPLPTDDVSVCQSEVFINSARVIVSSNAADNSTITITLPPGVKYVPGCINVVDANFKVSVSELDISDLSAPVFSIEPADLSAGNQFTFEYCRVADCDATAYQMGGGIFKDEIEICGDDGCINENNPNLNSYDLSTPSLSMASDGPITAAIGDNVCRNVTLTNGGLGYLDSVKYYIIDGPGTVTTSVTTPLGTVLTPIVNGDTLCYWLDAAVIAEFGDGDDFLENGEQIMLERCYDVTACENDSYYGAYWGCPGVCMSAGEIQQQTNIPNLVPNLSFGFDGGVNRDFCFKGQNAVTGGTAVIQRFELCNTGAGAATNVTFELHNNTPGSGTGQNYFTLEPGQIFDDAGAPLGTTSSQTSLYNGSYYQTGCGLESHPRAVEYELDGIIVPPGECIYVEIPTYANNITQECDAECNANIAWYYFNRTYSYQDACALNNYGRARQGIAYGGRQLYRYTVDMPTDMRDCDEFDLEVNYSNFYNNTKSTSEGSTEMKIDVSNTGLLYNGTGTETFKGINITVTQVGDTICVIYPHNAIPVGAGQLALPLKATCATGGGTKSIRMWHEGQYDDNCEGSTYHLSCLSRTYVMHCPDPCPEGGATPKLFTLERISLGLEDLDNNGIPDGTGTANPADVELHRASNCDTLKGTWEIYVHPNTVGPNAGLPFNHLYVEFDLNDLNLNCTYFETDNLFEPLPDAVATIFPADGSPSYTCTVTPTIEDTPGAGVDDLAKYDLSACKDNWADGDSIVFCALYKVTTSYHSSSFNQYVANNEVYSSYIENPVGVNPSDENKYTCDKYNDFMNVYRHYFSPWTPTPQTVNGCEGTLNYYLRYYINTQTGDVWYPNEYRPFTIPDKFTIELDDALAYRPGSVRFAGQVVPDADITHSGGFLTVCNLKQFFQGYGGPLLESDETWSYGLSVKLDPTCDAEPGIYRTRFSGQVIGNGCHSPDMNYIAVNNCSNTTGNSGYGQVLYDGPQPFLTGGGTIQFSSSTGCWDVILNNGSNNIDAPYTWFYIDGGANHVVEDAAGNPIAPDANGFYQLGDNPASNSEAYTVCAASSECDTVKINVLSGFGCTAYPADIGDLSCADTVQLIGLPLMSEVQLAFETQPMVPMQLCETQSFGLKMTSAQAAYLNDPRLSMLIPAGTSISNIQVEYPCGSGNIEAASSSQSGNLLLIDVEAHSAMSAEGMPGTIDALAPTEREACITFDLDTDCDFISSSGILFQAFGKRPCGDPAINNGVRVRSQDLAIDGVNQPHGASVTVEAALPELRGCGQSNEVEVNINFVSLGSNMTSPSDSVYITLDPGVEFVAGSILCCSANPAHCVTYAYDVTDAAGFTTVVLAFPSTPIDITNPVNMCFTYEVANGDDVVCDSEGAMNVQVRASAGDIVCTREAGGLCENVQTLTGEKEIIFSVEKTELNYEDDAVFNCTADGSIEYNIPITIDSLEIADGEILVVDIHCVTASGTVGAYVQSEVITGPVAAGTTVTLNGTVPPGTCNPEYGIMARVASPNNDGVDQCICDPLEIPSGALICPPDITHEKAFTSLTETAPGEYDVKWTITVTNNGMGDGDYNLNDLPGFDDDIEICGAEYTSDAAGNPGNPGALMLAIADTFKLAEDQMIGGSEVHTYCLIVHVKYDPAADPAVGDGVYTACEDGTLGDPTEGEGLYNQSQLDTNDDGVADEVDEVCEDLPCALTIVSAVPGECDPETSTYDLTVTVAYGAAPDCLINIGGQTFSIDGSGSESFVVTGLSADGAMGATVSAFFTCEATCFDQETYDAPEACSELTCSTTQVNILCHGDATGEATVTPDGGFAPYTYAWNSAPAQTAATATGLVAGAYSVTVTDDNDLQTVCSVTITEPVDLTCTVTKNSDISCNGLSDGGATVNPVGGTGSYTYSWSSGETTAIATALAAGTNTVTVTDANGCTSTCTVDITDPPAVACTISASTDPTCAGTATGTITVSGTGGTGTLEYSLDGGAFQLGGTFSGVSAGAHTITVRDANGCTSTCDETLTDPAALTCTTTENNPAACGMSNGQATVTPAGGTAPYTYLWDNTETTAQATALNAGTHSVTVTDANDCTTSCLVVINSTSGLECEISASQDVSCNGAGDGSATVAASGGTAPFTYAWSNSATTASISSLSGGTYTVTVTDATNCTTICMVTIAEATELICTMVKDNDISCNGVSDGGATVSASGGTPGYTYLWTGGETTPTASALASGTNFVTITDAAGCTTVCEVDIVEPAEISCSIDAFTDLTCNANSSGTITASATGGTGTLEYSINGGAFQLSGSFTGLPAGTHTVTIRDANGCTSNCSQALSEPLPLTCNAVAEEPTACGMDIGQATVTPSGGTAGYTYLWDNLETTATATSLSAGTHTVTVTDANDCTTTCQVVIESTSGLTCEITESTDVSCSGDADGSATVAGQGGSAPYTYAWDNGDITATTTGLSGGTYSVTVTDANNCTTICSATIAEATDLLCGAIKNSDVSCFGRSDGAAGVEASGGTPGYTYLWTSGETTSIATNLAAGTNSVTVTDADGCTTVCSVEIFQPQLLECEIDDFTNLSCYESGDGSITVTATGGVNPIEYSIDGGPFQISGVFTGLDATIHTVTVRDANGCTTECIQPLSQPQEVVCEVFEDKPTACGNDNGQASVLASGGIPGYTYAWDNLETTATAVALSAGIHTVTVTDANGCSTSCQVVISSTSGLGCEIVNSTDVSCNGEADGTAEVGASGGKAPYTYLWSNGVTTAAVTGLAGGVYDVVVTDADGCTTECSVTILEATLLTCTILKDNDISCNGETDGGATVNATGGTPGYTYAWSSGETTVSATALAAGINDVTITDADGCTTICEVEIIEPNPIACSIIDFTDLLCNGDDSGTITVSGTGGTGALEYSIDGGPYQSGGNFIGLDASVHTITVRDEEGCTSTCSQELAEPELLTCTVVADSETACMMASGSATVTPAGGTAGYTYLWDNLETTATAVALNAGTHTVVVTDANNCTTSCQVVIGTTSGLACEIISSSNVSCAGAADGAAEVSVVGGNGPYTYAWSDGSSTAAISGLSGGTYSVLIADADGCMTDCSVTITEATALLCNISNVVDISCSGESDGSATVEASGGVPGYTYAWPSGETSATAVGLAVGVNTVTITDSEGCTTTCDVTIVMPEPLTCSLASTPSGCQGQDDGTVTTTVSGGVAPFMYSINGGTNQTGAIFNNLPVGTYTVVVTDGNGCTTDCEIEVAVTGCEYDLSLIKKLAPGETGVYDPGDDVPFVITVCNQGQIPAEFFEVTDYIPTGMLFNASNAINVANGWAGAAGATVATTVSVAGGQLPAGGLTAGQCYDIDVVMTVDPSAPQGMSITNHAEISDDDGDDTDSTADNDDSNDGPPEDDDTSNTNGDEDDHDPETIEINFFDLALTKALATGQPALIAPGDNVTFTITIYNQGTIAADNIEITDYIPSCMTNVDPNWAGPAAGPVVYTLTAASGDLNTGGLAPGDFAQVDITLQVSSSANSACDLTNWAEISDDTDGDGDPIDDIDSTSDNDDTNDTYGGDDETDGANGDEDDHDPASVGLLEFDLALSKDLAAGQASAVAPGDLITYDITIINQGQFTTDSIEITDYIPACMTLADTDWTPAGANATYLMTVANGDLPAGGLGINAMASVEITLLLDNPVGATCDLTNWAEISDDQGEDVDSTPDDDDSNDPPNEDDIDDEPIDLLTFDLALSKNLAAGQSSAVAPGDDITFTIGVVNQGNINADNIEITDYLPSCTVLNDGAWTSTGPSTATYTLTVANGDLPAGGLPPNGVATVDITLTLDNPLDAANCDMTNWAEISDATDEEGMPQEDEDSDPDNDPNNDPPGEDDIDDEPFEVLEFDLALSKSLAAGQSSQVMPGDDVTFTFTIFNQGQIPADNIEISDYIPADFALNDSNWTGPNPAVTTLSVLNGDLPAGGLLPGQSTTVDITLTVLMTAVNGNTYVNVGEISDATDEDGDPQDDIDSDPDNDPNNDPAGEDDVDNEPLTIMGMCDLAQIKTVNRFDSFGNGTGGQITFDITVTNQGSCDAYNVGLVDYIIPTQDMVLNDPDWFQSPFNGFAYYTIPGPILPGDSVTVEITFDITSFDPNAPQVNWSEITGSEDFNGDPQEDEDSDPDQDPINDGPPTDDEQNNANNDEDDHDFEPLEIMDLAIDKSLDPSMTPPHAYGDDITFNICVTNEGNQTASSVVIADYIPAGFSFDGQLNPGWSGAAPTVTYTFTGPVEPGDQVCTDIILEFTNAGASEDDYTNVTEIIEVYDEDGNPENDDWDSTPDNDDGDQSEDDEDNEYFEVYDLDLDKSIVTPGPYSYGQDITFDIEICNTGTIVSQNIVVEDRFPCGFEFVSSAGWTLSGGTISTTIAGPLGIGACTTVPVTMRLQACDAVDAWVNEAEITDSQDEDGNPQDDTDSTEDNDDPTEDDQDTEVIDVFDLAQIKQVPAGEGPYLFGDMVEYLITVCNQGNVDAANITITDYIPAGLSFNPSYVHGSGTTPSANANWILDPVTGYATQTIMTGGTVLAPGACEELVIYLEVVPATAPEEWHNYSEISDATDGDGGATDDADSDPDDDDTNDDNTTDDAFDSEGGDEDDHDGAEIIVGFDLALTKTSADTGPFTYGQDIVFDITVYNQGGITAYNVPVIDYIPCGYEFVASPGWTYDAASSTATATIAGPITSGNNTSLQLTLKLVPCGDDDAWVNYSEITGGEDEDGNPGDDFDSTPDSDDSNDSGGTPGSSEDDHIDDDGSDGDGDGITDEDDHDPHKVDVFDLAQIKQVPAGPGPYLYGDIVEYVITVCNQGNVDAANITITDYLPSGLAFDPTYVHGSGTTPNANANWTQTGSNATQTIMTGGNVLEPGDCAELVIYLEVVPAMVIEDWYNFSEISSATDGNGGPVGDADSTPDSDNSNDDNSTDDAFDSEGGDEDDHDGEEILVTGEIGDTVWKDLDGDGIQDPGEPGVANVIVSLYDCAGNLVRKDTTDGSGYYLFDLVLPGDYQLNFDISGLAPGCAFTFPGQGQENEDSDADLNGNTTCITLEAGENNHDIDVGLLRLTCIGDLAWHDLNGNGVQDGGEPGLPGVVVRLYEADGTFVASTTTDSNGNYLFDDLYPGDYYLQFTPTSQYPLITDANQGSDTELDSDIDHSNGNNTTPITTLGADGTCDRSWDAGFYDCVPIGELVWYDLDEDNIADSHENGINGLEIELYRRVNGTWKYWDSEITGYKPGTASDDGYFKFCAPPGEYHLKAKLPGGGLVLVDPNVGNDDTVDSDFDESNGPNTSETFNVVCGGEKCDLAAGLYTMSSVGSLVWQDDNADGLRQSDEAPLAGVKIEAYDIYNDLVGIATSDEEGKYMIDHLKPEGYYLKVYPPAGLQITDSNIGSDDENDSDVDHTNGKNTTDYIMMTPGAHLDHVDIGLVAFDKSPFEITEFYGKYRPDFIELNWKTVSEEHISYYQVERRHESTQDYEMMGKILVNDLAKGYDVTDYDIEADGVYYYRLISVDQTGVEQISDEIGIDVSSYRADGVSIYPNPAISDVNVEFTMSVSKLVTLNLYNTQGALVQANLFKDVLDQGTTSINLNVSNIPAGVYNLVVDMGDKTLSKRMILLSN